MEALRQHNTDENVVILSKQEYDNLITRMNGLELELRLTKRSLKNQVEKFNGTSKGISFEDWQKKKGLL